MKVQSWKLFGGTVGKTVRWDCPKAMPKEPGQRYIVWHKVSALSQWRRLFAALPPAERLAEQLAKDIMSAKHQSFYTKQPSGCEVVKLVFIAASNAMKWSHG